MRNPGTKCVLIHNVKEKSKMGKLVIDGKCVYEIDEECVKRHRLPKECGIYEHLTDQKVGNKKGSAKKESR